jgi:hypothetical protein
MIECQPMQAVEYPRGALRIGHDGVLVISAQKVTLSKSLISADIFGTVEYKSLMSLTISVFALRGSLR